MKDITTPYEVVSNGSKILIESKSQHKSTEGLLKTCCFQWFKDTNLKANHNILAENP